MTTLPRAHFLGLLAAAVGTSAGRLRFPGSFRTCCFPARPRSFFSPLRGSPLRLRHHLDDGNAHAVASASDTGLFRYVSESSVAIVFVECVTQRRIWMAVGN